MKITSSCSFATTIEMPMCSLKKKKTTTDYYSCTHTQNPKVIFLSYSLHCTMVCFCCLLYIYIYISLFRVFDSLSCVFTVAFCSEHKDATNRIGKSMKKFHLKHTHNANAIKANKQNAANDAKEDARFVCNRNRFWLFTHSVSIVGSFVRLLVALQMQLQLMHDFWRVSANVILYLCMRNASISIAVSFSIQWKRKAKQRKKKKLLALSFAVNRSWDEHFSCLISVSTFFFFWYVYIFLAWIFFFFFRYFALLKTFFFNSLHWRRKPKRE